MARRRPRLDPCGPERQHLDLIAEIQLLDRSTVDLVRLGEEHDDVIADLEPLDIGGRGTDEQQRRPPLR